MNQEEWLAERRRLGLPADPAKDFPPTFREDPGATGRRHGSAAAPGANRSPDQAVTALQAEQRRLAEAARRAAQIQPGPPPSNTSQPRPAQPHPAQPHPAQPRPAPQNVPHQYSPPMRPIPSGTYPQGTGNATPRVRGAGWCVVVFFGFIVLFIVSIALVIAGSNPEPDESSVEVTTSYSVDSSTESYTEEYIEEYGYSTTEN
ncbi:hypothetical protein [Galactobacter caseinivorans]|uniref:Uncharacterized protein n=1 Tax=Galactobacter caseinivorans TaxID=2676123 RepID=A0A496PGF8_9MICC|nr:hypothetical protein [Galactobacter caseinivorans]RKW69554.1 hypothetical protein DWQ67_12175 [Galactobacter caseinivorans]